MTAASGGLFPESGGNPPHAEMLAARQAALDILHAVLDQRQLLDTVLEQNEGYRHLPGRDRAFSRMAVSTALRRLGQIDDLIVKAADRPEPVRPPQLHNLLRLGVAQIAFMAVPDYAVVDTAVRIAEAGGLARQKGFVNAVLRQAARSHKEWVAGQDEARLNIPGWLMAAWIADYGPQEAAEIALGSLAEAPLDVSVKNPGMADYWAGTLEAVILPTGTLRRMAGGAVHGLPGFDDGMWWVQDAAAALPAQLFGDVRGRTVADLCAAPGGKTAQLAVQGASVIAVDRSVQRLRRLEDNLRRLRLEENVTTVAADAAVWRPAEPLQFVLLDAPCSATGTVRRHPDILHLKTPQDVERLASIQEKLLQSAVEMLAPGGTLVYCTCSLQKAEGERQVEKLLEGGAPVKRLPVEPAEVGGLERILTPQGDVRCLPYHLAAQGGMDGFYVARLVKE